jgi:hypothetical protein
VGDQRIAKRCPPQSTSPSGEASGSALSVVNQASYFGPNSSSTSGSFFGDGSAGGDSVSFLAVLVVLTSEGVVEEDFGCFFWVVATTKLRVIGLFVLRSLRGIRILSPKFMRLGLSLGFAFVSACQLSASPVYHLAIMESVSPEYLTLW